MSRDTYVDEFTKIAYEYEEDVREREYNRDRVGLKRRIGNALLIGLGTGLGAGAGTLAANLLTEKAPAILKSPYLPLGLGAGATGLSILTQSLDEERE